jgi:polyferredoxin
VQIVDMAQALPPSVPPDQSTPKGKAAKKRAAPVPTHIITSVPIDMTDSKGDNKKQFKCMDCGKCVSSSRNLNRHMESCKAKKVLICFPSTLVIYKI